MRIAIVHSFYTSRSASGENEVVKAQVQSLRAAGHEVRLVARHTDVEEQRPGYRLTSALRVASGRGQTPEDELRDFDPDIVHVHNLFPNLSTHWLERWADRTVVTIHNFRPICPGGTLWRDGDDCEECLVAGNTEPALKHRCYRDSVVATLPLAIASRGRGKAQPVLHEPARVVVLNERARGIYSRLTQRPVVTIANFVQAASLPQQERQGWLYVGRLSPEKGPVELVRDMPSTSSLRVVGDGPQSDQVRELAQSRPQVELLGRMTPEQVRDEMARSVGLVIPSLCAEGLPTVALEALSAGTPVLISKRCVSGPQLTADGAGLIYDPNDARSLDAAMKSIEANAEQSGRAARALFDSRYSEAIWLKQIEALYGEVLEESRR